MQRILGYLRKAIQEFDLIQEGDRIAVGVSGGKDSVALLAGLAQLRRFLGVSFEVVAITLDPCFGGTETDYSAIAALCERLQVPYILKRTQIGEIVFDIRKEDHPCSLCAKLRRGALHDAAIEAGCNKIALGHHYNDAVETFVMNLFNEGRIGCFSPKSYLSRKDLWLIRPMVFAPEKEIKASVRRAGLPIVKSRCPADGNTSRERTKEFLHEREQVDKGFTYRLFGALRRSGVDGWGYTDKGGTALIASPAVQEGDLILREATILDAPKLRAIYAPYVERTAVSFEYELPSPEEFIRRVETIRQTHPYLVAERQGEVVGYAYASPFHVREAYRHSAEVSIYVKQDARRSGVGRALYRELETRLQAQGITKAIACVAIPEVPDEYLSTDSVAFHQRMGYRMVGTFPKIGYKFDRWYGMCYLEKDL